MIHRTYEKFWYTHTHKNMFEYAEQMFIYKINLFQRAGNKFKTSFNLDFHQYCKAVAIKSKQ